MHRLFLMRHAKAALPHNIDDHERPLAPRGREAASLIAKHILNEGYEPDLVLVSSAKRTQETFSLVRSAMPNCKFVIKRELYGASLEDLLEIICGVETPVKSLMIIGHNPGLAELTESLVDEAKSNPAAMKHLSVDFPTASFALFEFKLNHWSDVGLGQGNLRQFITPKLLGGVDEH
jgi:phosphohistidine phosphatase